MPAADTDTQDSVRARRRRCAEPSRVSCRRRIGYCRYAKCLGRGSGLFSSSFFSAFPVVYVSQYSRFSLLHSCLPSDGCPMGTYVETLGLVASW